MNINWTALSVIVAAIGNCYVILKGIKAFSEWKGETNTRLNQHDDKLNKSENYFAEQAKFNTQILMNMQHLTDTKQNK